MNILIDKEKCVKWTLGSNFPKISNEEKASWMEEYASLHARPHIDYWDVPEQKPKYNPHPDIDPYGEEIWDDDINISTQYYEPLLPIATRIAAKTIGLDLVSVKPLESPISFISRIDFKYGDKEETPKGKQIFSDIDPYGEENWEE